MQEFGAKKDPVSAIPDADGEVNHRLSLPAVSSLDRFALCLSVCLSASGFTRCFPLLPLQDCAQVPTDGLRSVSRNKSYGVYDGSTVPLNPPVSSEIKDGQWLGVEVESQGDGGKVIVCAHRSVNE